MEFDRRAVLRGGVAGAAVLCLYGGTSSTRAQGAVVAPSVFVESAIGESRRFAAAHRGAGLHVVDSELNGLVGRSLPGGIVVGLTSHPVAMIAEQLLREAGGEPLFRWSHRHEDGGWQHELDADGVRLEAARAMWPDALAGLVDDRLRGIGTASTAGRYCSGACALSPRSPSVLVSWGFNMPVTAL